MVLARFVSKRPLPFTTRPNFACLITQGRQKSKAMYQDIVRKILPCVLGAVLASSLFAECHASPTPADQSAFSRKLYRELRSHSEHFMFSPYSISAAMLMTLPGAKGETRAQLATALEVQNSDEYLEQSRILTKKLESHSITFTVANSLWGEQSYGIQDSYIDTVKRYFRSEVTKVDFKNNPGEQRLLINRWVSDKTNDKINDLLGEAAVKSETRIILTNAVYFLGKWKSVFDADDTRPGDFHVTTSMSLPARFMSQTKDFKYYEDDSVQVLQLPYEGEEFAMEIFLPKGTLADIEEKFLEGKSTHWLNNVTTKRVLAQIPRFKAESSLGLVETLSNLGIKNAFIDGVADFSGISNNRELFISDVVHKTFIEVGEKGTEAAAATAVIMGIRSAMQLNQEKPILFRADKPFVYQIRHLASNTIIFLGRLNKL